MADDASKPKKKGGKLKKILVLTIAIAGLVGGGVAGGLYAAGAGLVGGAHATVEDPNRPKLVPRGGEHGEAAPAPAPAHGPAASDEAHVDPRLYQATYVPLEQTFTANLSDTDGFLQVGLGVSTYYDERVVENLKKDDMPVRSAILLALAEQSAEALSTPEGKTQLQRRLKDAINQTLRQKEGFGGIDSVYFTSFIVQ